MTTTRDGTASENPTQAGGTLREPRHQTLLSAINPGAVATVAIALTLTVVLLVLVWFLIRPIAILLFGIIIAQALGPIVGRLQAYMSRQLAIAAVYVTIFAMIGLIGWIIVPALVDQGRDLGERAPELFESAQSWLMQNGLLDERITTDQIEERVTSWIGQFSGQLVSLPMTIIGTLFEVLMVVIISIYWLVAGPGLRRFLLSLFPWQRQGRVNAVVSEMGHTMGGYVRGIVINASIMGVIAFIGLTIIGVQYALVLALLAALLDVVPIVGPVITTIPIVGFALLSSPTTALIALVFWVVAQQVENYVIMPNVMSKQADLPPLMVLLAIFAGGGIGGILGALIAIPLTGALRVYFLRVVAPAIRRWTGAIDTEFVGPPLPPPGGMRASA